MKTIYKPKGKAGEYAQYACNFYTGCSNDCDYCYCKRGVMARLWDDKPHLRKRFKDTTDAYGQFIDDLLKHSDEIKQGGGIFFSFTTDPCLPETQQLTMVCANYAMEDHGIPCYILTKCVSKEFEKTLREFAFYGYNIAVGYTLTGRDGLEPNASSNEERIEAMKRIHDMGIKTFASIEPIIDFPNAMYVMRKTFGYCDLYKVGLRSGVKKNYYKDSDILDFYWWLYDLEGGQKVYLKDSFIDRIPYRYRPNVESHKVFVKSDYDLFKTQNEMAMDDQEISKTV